MANDKKPPAEPTTSGIFTLDPEDLKNGIPGVTTLLSVKRDGKKITSLEKTKTFTRPPELQIDNDVAKNASAGNPAPAKLVVPAPNNKPAAPANNTAAPAAVDRAPRELEIPESTSVGLQSNRNASAPASKPGPARKANFPVEQIPATTTPLLATPPKPKPVKKSAYDDDTPENTSAFPANTSIDISLESAEKEPPLELTSSYRVQSVRGQPEPIEKTTLAPKKLRDYGVVFEIHFDLRDGSMYQYAKVVNHNKITLEPWQLAILDKAIFRLDLMLIKTPFTEYNSQQQNGFIFDAIGADPKMYMQVVQVHNPGKRLYILVSQTTLFAKKDEIIACVRASDGDMSGTIEVDLAG